MDIACNLMNSSIRSEIIGSGSYLPDKVVTNQDLESVFETSHDWIVERTGILQRHVADSSQKTSDLCIEAAKNAISDAGIDAKEIDVIILATSTPDNTFPATACAVQVGIGATNSCAFDIQAVCSGFVFAMTTADVYIKQNMAKTVLVVGGEIFSRIVNPVDRSTGVLFGDGAGAVILRATSEDNGIITSILHTDGVGYDALKTSFGPCSGGRSGYIEMNGRYVFRRAVEELTSIVGEILAKAQLSHDDIDWFIPHQANKRIINAVANNINIDREKIIFTGDVHANTSAASVPLAFDVGIKSGKIKKGDIVLFESFGAGFSWGAIIARI